MKRYQVIISLFILVFSSALTFAQKAEQEVFIVNFYEDPTDLDAKNYPKTDKLGHLYALIKVRPESSAFAFEFRGVKIESVEKHKDETWIYVQKNAKYITITRDGFKPIKEKQLDVPTKAGCTYILELSYTDPSTIVKKQFLKFDVSPHEENAIVKVKAPQAKEYEVWGATNNGTFSRYLDCGTYAYQISAEGYEPSDGLVFLDKPDSTKVEKVTLVPNFGFIQIDDAYGISGAEIFLDDKKIGTIPYQSKERFTAGSHRLTITNGELYKPYTDNVNIVQGKTTTLAPRLESNAAETTLQVEGNAEIYLDGKLMGKHEWVGPLKEGNYNIECRLHNHETTKKTITVKANQAQTIKLTPPEPITGKIAITSTPDGADIKMDGQKVGITPKTIPSVIIGNHNLSVSLSNYKTEEREVTVEKDKTTYVEVSLSTIAKMSFKSTPTNATLYLNGERVGETPIDKVMASGDYDVKLVKKGYCTYTQRKHFDSSTPQQHFKLHRQYFNKSNIYFGATFSAPGLMAVGAHLGGYIYHVNIEADYKYGLSKSETIYWNNIKNNQDCKSEEITAHYAGGKIGYGFTFNTRFTVTPQVGGGILLALGDHSKSFAVIGTAGIRSEFAIVRHFGISLTPEYRFMFKKSDTFKRLSQLSDKFNAWGSGFTCTVGLFVYF